MQDWYDKVCQLIPQIHRYHDVYLPQPLWDEILKLYTHSYDNIIAIVVHVDDNNKQNDKHNDNVNTDSDNSDSEEDPDKNAIKLNKRALKTLKKN